MGENKNFALDELAHQANCFQMIGYQFKNVLIFLNGFTLMHQSCMEKHIPQHVM